MLYPGMRIGQLRLEINTEPKELHSQKHIEIQRAFLEHDLSRQNRDFEVELIREYNRKLNNRGLF